MLLCPPICALAHTSACQGVPNLGRYRFGNTSQEPSVILRIHNNRELPVAAAWPAPGVLPGRAPKPLTWKAARDVLQDVLAGRALASVGARPTQLL